MESPRADVDFECEPLRTVVIKRHYATDSTQLELQLNDIVMVLEKDNTGWWGGHKEGEELTGWFPGFCVQACPLPESEAAAEQENACEKQLEPIRNAALETEASSPMRRNHAVASPQRRSILPSSAPKNEGASSTEAYGVLNSSSRQEQLLQEKSQQCIELDSEVTKLKRDKETLEEALRQAQKQTSLDREECKMMEVKLTEAERKLQTESSQRKATLKKCEQLEEVLRNRDVEVATLRRLSAASPMTPHLAAQSPPQQATDEGPRRRLFPSEAPNGTSMLNTTALSTTNFARSPSPPASSLKPVPSVPNGTSMLNITELNTTSLARSPSPQPVASSGCNASLRETSCCARRSEEEPPVGYVKQLRNAFEARSATPQRADRAESRTRGRNENARPRTINTTVATTTAPSSSGATKGGSQFSQIPRPTGLAISTEAPAEEIVYGMSPINSQNKKDLKKSIAQSGA